MPKGLKSIIQSTFIGIIKFPNEALYFLHILLFFFIGLQTSAAQQKEIEIVPISLEISKLGSYNILCIVDNYKVYVPVIEFFELLKIKNKHTSNFEEISGFIIQEENNYNLNSLTNEIYFEGKTTAIAPDDIKITGEAVYLEASNFGPIFGLQLNFNYRKMSLGLKTNLKLPFIRSLEREQIYKKLGITAPTISADTLIPGHLRINEGAIMDWAVTSTQISERKSRYTATLGIGAGVLGGETQLNLYYNNQSPVEFSHQSFRWRYVNNSARSLKEVVFGRITPSTISSVFNPIYGASLSSSPSIRRTMFGTYKIQDKTEPDWLVELYVNDNLLDYQRADKNGAYSFDIPLIYGNSKITFVFIGPWGEERTQEKRINIPYDFIPKGTLEYTMHGGKVLDDGDNYVFKGQFFYGLGNRITIGAGLEYLSEGNEGKPIPFTTSSVRLGSNLLFSAARYFGVLSQFSLNVNMPLNAQLQIDYNAYERDQKAVLHSVLQKQKVVLQLPLKINKFSSLHRFTFAKLKLPQYDVANLDWHTSLFLYGVNANFSTTAILRDSEQISLYSNLSMQLQHLPEIAIIPELKYEHNSQTIRSVKLAVEKRIINLGAARLFYERDLASNQNYLGFSARFNVNHLQFSVSERHSKKYFSTTQAASGSILYHTKSDRIQFNNMHSMGQGVLTLLPFLDLNANGVQDKKEPLLHGLKYSLDGGHRKRKNRNGSISLLNLVPYKRYLLRVNPGSFDQIAWVIKDPVIAIDVVPNQNQQIYIPVSVMGEIEGHINNPTTKSGKLIGGIPITIHDVHGKLVATIISENDGYFGYFGLLPGQYELRIDKTYIKNLGMAPKVSVLPFQIKGSADGDFLDGFNFELLPIANIP
ncbi:carboxypeptidase-like regulatory domain-containing protein [Sediminicola sp. 1XM1-17]|uniref:carboxypeptidase-like regulatory domain-containing protein n=1 Tax=Sediminicola sp. 1XM1-17 TaxID=3127702 RepID=UPI00307810BD